MKLLTYLLIPVGAWFIATTSCMAQDKEYQYVHQGNKCLERENPSDAETFYQRALTLSPNNSRAYYDLGNALFAQNRKEDAMKAYGKGADMEKNRLVKSMAYHNMGVLSQTDKNLTQAIEYYKEALRNNPADEEARYNLVLCQHQLKNQGGQNQEQQDKDDQEGNDKQQQQEQPQQQEEQEQQQQQESQDQMSKDNAEQLLNLSKQEEENTRRKVQQNGQRRTKRLEKNW